MKSSISRRWSIFGVGQFVARCTAGIMATWIAITPIHAQSKESFGHITKFAQVPASPGFPEGIAVHGNSVFVSGPARFGLAGTGPSAIQVFNRKTGQLSKTISVQGEDLQFENALSNIAISGDGDIFALSTQLGLIRFSKQGQQYVQSAFGDPLPDLPALSPMFFDFPPLPNDVVFDDLGFLFVTDSLQGTIFRYAPTGGEQEYGFKANCLWAVGFFLLVRMESESIRHDIGCTLLPRHRFLIPMSVQFIDCPW